MMEFSLHLTAYEKVLSAKTTKAIIGFKILCEISRVLGEVMLSPAIVAPNHSSWTDTCHPA